MLKNKPLPALSQLSIEANSIAQQLIIAAKNYQQRCLILLDPFLSSLNDTVIDYFADLKRLHQVRIMHPSILADKRPQLLELDLTDIYQQQALTYFIDKALKQLSADYLSYGNGQQYCAWLLTHTAVNHIADDLANLALQKADNKTIFLRFYDPAIFKQLMSLLTELQQKKLLGQIEYWATLNYDRQLNIEINHGKLVPVLSGQLGINRKQLTQLYCIGINNQIIQTQRLLNPTIGIDVIASLKQISPCIERMLIKNIQDESLLIEWATLALKFGVDFDLQPGVVKSTEHFRTRYQYYEWLDSMTQQNWQLITQENIEK